jgi:pantoate--beta-alanine ligase
VKIVRSAVSATKLRSLHGAGPLILVPTMGALHAGHLSLVARARQENDIVTASLFVNPTQFAPGEDFDRYPRQLAQDCALFESAGVDLVFAPSAAEMYPDGATTFVDVGELGTRLDGASRPGHFLGVATVVAKLFHIVQPNRAYFGQKDAVQIAVLRRMVRDLNFPLELIACPIVRDADGLALSSRNAYLTPDERAHALALPRTLEAVRQALASSRETTTALQPALTLLAADPAVNLEYLEAVDPLTLLPVATILPGTLIAIAAKIGKTRLIDNFLA